MQEVDGRLKPLPLHGIEKRRLAPLVDLVDTHGTFLHEVLAEPRLSYYPFEGAPNIQHSLEFSLDKTTISSIAQHTRVSLLLRIEAHKPRIPTPRTHPSRWVWPSLAA